VLDPVEVYRADDLKLGQVVALTFLPQDVAEDLRRLQRFIDEVRLSRQVSHPNVCRVCDLAELDSQHLLSMEYIEGEDLRSLLRRFGRLPREKVVHVAQQLCAGLAAAQGQPAAPDQGPVTVGSGRPCEMRSGGFPSA